MIRVDYSDENRLMYSFILDEVKTIYAQHARTNYKNVLISVLYFMKHSNYSLLHVYSDLHVLFVRFVVIKADISRKTLSIWFSITSVVLLLTYSAASFVPNKFGLSKTT